MLTINDITYTNILNFINNVKQIYSQNFPVSFTDNRHRTFAIKEKELSLELGGVGRGKVYTIDLKTQNEVMLFEGENQKEPPINDLVLKIITDCFRGLDPSKIRGLTLDAVFKTQLSREAVSRGHDSRRDDLPPAIAADDLRPAMAAGDRQSTQSYDVAPPPAYEDDAAARQTQQSTSTTLPSYLEAALGAAAVAPSQAQQPDVQGEFYSDVLELKWPAKLKLIGQYLIKFGNLQEDGYDDNIYKTSLRGKGYKLTIHSPHSNSAEEIDIELLNTSSQSTALVTGVEHDDLYIRNILGQILGEAPVLIVGQPLQFNPAIDETQYRDILTKALEIEEEKCHRVQADSEVSRSALRRLGYVVSSACAETIKDVSLTRDNINSFNAIFNYLAFDESSKKHFGKTEHRIFRDSEDRSLPANCDYAFKDDSGVSESSRVSFSSEGLTKTIECKDGNGNLLMALIYDGSKLYKAFSSRVKIECEDSADLKKQIIGIFGGAKMKSEGYERLLNSALKSERGNVLESGVISH